MAVRARDNPFAVQRVRAIGYVPRGWTWDELLARLEAAGWRGAIVGPHGSGKTTLMETLAERLAQRGLRPILLRLNIDKRQLDEREAKELESAGADHVILVDGSEQLSLWAWRHIARQARPARGMVITAHGRARLPVLLRCEAEPGMLMAIVHQLTSTHELDIATAAGLLARHQGNMRHALLELYDRWCQSPLDRGSNS